jgi:predicted dehydrogenase
MIKNVAVVGCGIGRTHIVSYAAHPDKFRVIAICDLNDERLASIGDEFGIERRTKD